MHGTCCPLPAVRAFPLQNEIASDSFRFREVAARYVQSSVCRADDCKQAFAKQKVYRCLRRAPLIKLRNMRYCLAIFRYCWDIQAVIAPMRAFYERRLHRVENIIVTASYELPNQNPNSTAFLYWHEAISRARVIKLRR